jgi:hypothetical protein
MGCSSRRACAFLLLSLAMACSRAQSTSTATQPADLTAADAATPPLEFPHPWGPASTRIAVRSFGFWDGSTRFEADRTELTPVQLGALDGLRRIPPPEGPAASDLTSYVIGITDDAGKLATYRAAQGNITDGDEADREIATLDIHTLEPFLATFDCLTATETRDRFGVAEEADAGPSDAGAAALWSEAPTVSTDTPGCFHGVFVPYECHDVWLRLNVEAAGSYRLSAVDCFEQLELSVLSPDGSSELAQTSGSGGSCPALRYAFTEPGSYPLRLRKENTAGCSALGTAGDFFFRVQPQAIDALGP